MCRLIRVRVLVLIGALSFGSFVAARCPVGDLNRDCHVGLEDLRLLFEQWLVYPENSSDLNGDDIADMADLALLAMNWSKTGIPLLINEFLASNSNIKPPDPQGQFDDWVEIYNFGNKAINTGGMYLTDDLNDTNKWRIPDNNPSATTIPAHGYLLIWADNDTADPGLHASFRLDADDGEDVGFFDIDGSTLIDSISFGEQTTDISYGRYPDASNNWRLMTSPSPGYQNVSIYEGFVADMEFSRDSSLFYAPFYVMITTETEGASVYYTLDGSSPYNFSLGIPTGTRYSGPIYIGNSTLLKAVACKPGWKPTDVATRMYTLLAVNVQSFSSNLPIVVVDTFGAYVGETTQTPAFASFISTTTQGRANITDQPGLVCRAGINIRGKSSMGFPKKQYHFETWDEHNDDKDVPVLGFPAESDWVLQGPYSDKSLMRNVLAYQWSNDIGRYAARTMFVEMFLNTDRGELSLSDYVGVYAFMEKIKRGESRVNITKLEPTDNAEPQITGGYIIKKDKLDPDEQIFYTSTGLQLIYVEPKGTEITQAQKSWIKGYLDEFESVLYGPSFADPVNGYAKYIDVDSFIDHHILVELAKNIDGFRLSTYMFKDRGGKLNMGPVWDYDLSLGNADYLEGWKPDGWYYSQLGNYDYPWWRRLFEDHQFQWRYASRWYELRKNVFATERLLQNIDNWANLLNEAQVRNFVRWPILGIYVWPNWFIANTYQEEINWMKNWLRDRLTWMDYQIGSEFIGLVANWKLDETEGTVARDSIGNKNGNLNGGPVWQPAGGVIDGALQLDGTNDYVSTPFILNPSRGQFTALAWVKGGNPGQVVLSQIASFISPAGKDWLCTDPTEGRLMTALTDGSPTTSPLISEFVITDGNWHYIAVTWDGSRRRLYADGIKVAEDSNPLANLVSSDKGLYLGAGKTLTAGTFWSGLIDDIRIYDREVTP